MLPYNLFLDDIREPADCIFHKDDERYIDLKWTVVRSHDEFVKVLEDKFQNGELPSLISFDHDLNHEHYNEAMWKGIHAYENAYKSFTTPTGRRSAEYLVEFCKKKGIAIPECLIHSMNPVGHIRIEKTLRK